MPLFRSLACQNQLCRAAAGRCVGAIRDCIGPGIFGGRLTEEQKAIMERSQDVPPLAGTIQGTTLKCTSLPPKGSMTDKLCH